MADDPWYPYPNPDEFDTDAAAVHATALLRCFRATVSDAAVAGLVQAAEAAQNYSLDEDDTKVLIEVDDGGRRLALSAENDRGFGGGYRMFGRKFGGVAQGGVTKHVLTDEDVQQLRHYLAVYDRIQARAAATIDAALTPELETPR